MKRLISLQGRKKGGKHLIGKAWKVVTVVWCIDGWLLGTVRLVLLHITTITITITIHNTSYSTRYIVHVIVLRITINS